MRKDPVLDDIAEGTDLFDEAVGRLDRAARLVAIRRIGAAAAQGTGAYFDNGSA